MMMEYLLFIVKGASRVRFTNVFFSASILITALTPANADWASEAKYACDDPFIIRDQSFYNQLFPRPASSIYTPVQRQNIRVEIDQKYINDNTVRVGAAFISKRIEMGSNHVALFKQLLEQRFNANDIPFYISGGLPLASYILTAGEGLIIKPIFDFLFAQAGVRKAKAEVLLAFVAATIYLTKRFRWSTFFFKELGHDKSYGPYLS